jgi:formate hydrogenlyase subunit 3/multisubunit Na+/H+ antiporter MnhD subunit
MDGIASLGKIIILIGIVIVIFGAVVLVLSYFTRGRGAPLPGDIVIRRDNITIYFPIITSLVISIILTLVLWIVFAYRR